MNKFKKLLYKLGVKLHLISPAGFQQLYYRGLPVVLRDEMPENVIAFANKDGKTGQLLNIKTLKVTKLKRYDWFKFRMRVNI